MFTVAVLTFLMVTVFEAGTFKTTFPKLRFAGVNINGDAGPFCPVPVRPPTAGLPPAL